MAMVRVRLHPRALMDQGPKLLLGPTLLGPNSRSSAAAALWKSLDVRVRMSHKLPVRDLWSE